MCAGSQAGESASRTRATVTNSRDIRHNSVKYMYKGHDYCSDAGVRSGRLRGIFIRDRLGRLQQSGYVNVGVDTGCNHVSMFRIRVKNAASSKKQRFGVPGGRNFSLLFVTFRVLLARTLRPSHRDQTRGTPPSPPPPLSQPSVPSCAIVF
mgnify:CR=1 FL=1